MANTNMTFKANLLPNSNLGYNLGSSNQKWNVYGDLTGNADTSTKVKLTAAAEADCIPSGYDEFQMFRATSSTTGGGDGYIGTWRWSGGGYLTQLYVDVDPNWIMALRHRNNSSEWTAWKRIPMGDGTGASGSWGISITGNAASATNADKVDNKHASDLVWNGGNMNSLGSGTPASDCQTYFTDTMTNYQPLLTYNTSGAEYTVLFTGRKEYGSILKWGYSDTYLRILRRQGSAWKTTDWEKISAGYADSAGAVAWGNVTGKPSTFTPASHSHSDYVLKNSTYTGNLNSLTTSGFYRINNGQANAPSDWGQVLVCHGNSDTIFQLYGHYADGHFAGRAGNPSEVGGSGVWSAWRWFWMRGDSVTGAVWNDYAEYREAETIEPGYIFCEKGDGSLFKSTKRCQEFAGVSSDTWGFAQGETEKAKTPIAVSGRVLVYIKDKVKVNDYICSGPDGIGLKMRWWEKILYPHCVVGIVSEIPTYEKWGGGENADRDPVDVNGRIWIKCCN